MARIYLDACVFISYTKQEMGWNLRGLFIEAERFFDKVKKNGDSLVLSDLFFYEVKKKTHLERESVLAELAGIDILYEILSPAQKPPLQEIEASGIHRPDLLHVGLAIQAECDYIATFNIRDFIPAKKWIKVIQPNDY